MSKEGKIGKGLPMARGRFGNERGGIRLGVYESGMCLQYKHQDGDLQWNSQVNGETGSGFVR